MTIIVQVSHYLAKSKCAVVQLDIYISNGTLLIVRRHLFYDFFLFAY